MTEVKPSSQSRTESFVFTFGQRHRQKDRHGCDGRGFDPFCHRSYGGEPQRFFRPPPKLTIIPVSYAPWPILNWRMDNSFGSSESCCWFARFCILRPQRATHDPEPAGAAPWDTSPKKDVETTCGAITMRWGGFLLAIFIVFHLLHFTAGVVGFQPGQFEHLMVYQNVVAGFSVWPISARSTSSPCALCVFTWTHGIWAACFRRWASGDRG